MTSAAASLILGIAACKFFPLFPFSIIILSLLTASFLFFRQGKNKRRIFLIILVFIFGFLYSLIRSESLQDVDLPDKASFVKGAVVDVPETSDENLRFTINDVFINGKSINGKIRLFLPEEAYRDKTDLLPAYGDRISAVAILREPAPPHNPGVFSYDIRKEGITATGSATSLEITQRGQGLLAWIYKERRRLGVIIDKSLSKENASFHKAIIQGFHRGIGQDMRDGYSVQTYEDLTFKKVTSWRDEIRNLGLLL